MKNLQKTTYLTTLEMIKNMSEEISKDITVLLKQNKENENK